MQMHKDPRGVPNHERLINDTARIVAFVEAETGLSSRWQGEVLVSEVRDLTGEPAFLGRKLPGCPIEYHQTVLGDVECYYVGLEEALHSCSVLFPTDGENLQHFELLEEATVAACLELLKPGLRSLFDECELPDTLRPLRYERQLRALGSLRRLSDQEHRAFYFGLLGTPLVRREHAILKWIAQARRQRIEPVQADSEIISLLKLVEGTA